MPRILLADDEPAFRSLFELWLRSGDFDVTVAPDGVEALVSMLRDGFPDAVVLDVRMPRLDGFELCRILRRVRPELPVVLISAEDDLAELGRMAGASAVLGKPASAAELCGVLGNLLPASAPAVYAA
jgi:CheY-like chemotaxis protein